jgi:hypothetical protein
MRETIWAKTAIRSPKFRGRCFRQINKLMERQVDSAGWDAERGGWALM